MTILTALLTAVAALLPHAPPPVDGWQADPERVAARAVRVNTWSRLADCESGEWVDRGADFIPGSADWQARDHYRGGLQFAPATWAAFRPDHYPADAADATRWQQIAVAERVLDVQGWRAWPVCSRLTGIAQTAPT